MKILSYNPGHDGAIAYLKDGHLMFSIEAEKNSNYRYSPVSSPDVFNILGEIDEIRCAFGRLDTFEAAAFSPDGKTLATVREGNASSIDVWDLTGIVVPAGAEVTSANRLKKVK